MLVAQMSSRHSNLDVHEWHGSFQGRPAVFRMTSVIGHVLSIDFPGELWGPWHMQMQVHGWT